MKKIHSLYALAFGLLLSSCGDSTNQGAQPGQQQAAPFKVTVVPQKTTIAYKTFPTTIQGVINSEIRPKVSGYIEKVMVDEGQKVSKGQILFRLETQTLSQDAAAAQANVNAAQVEVEKLIPLVEKNIISKVQLETAKAKLAQAKSGYNSLNANIGYATVRSSVDGYVGAINYREGSLVSSTNTTPLTTVSDIKEVYAFFSMGESAYLDFIQTAEGKTIQDKINNFPNIELLMANGKPYDQPGKIETVTGQIDRQTGTVSFRAKFDNPSQLLTNGNSGVIRIPVTHTDAIVVPQFATFEQQGQIFVYKVSEDNKALATPISILDRSGNLYVVESGLEKGDKIIVEGIGKLRNQTAIQPTEVAFDSIAKPIKPLFQ